MLFLAAKVSHLAKLPQGKVEAKRRAKAMYAKMDELGFGGCTNTGACELACPKSISIAHIARLNQRIPQGKNFLINTNIFTIDNNIARSVEYLAMLLLTS